MRIKINLGGTGETVFYILLGVVLALGINMVLGQALSSDMPVVAVESNSMIPTFSQGDILIIQGMRDPGDYIDFLKVNDIIVFSVEGRLIPIVHRIIKVNPDNTFQTKGDASMGQHSFEKHIKPEQIHGKVMTIIPYLGWVKIGVTEYVLPFIVKNILLVITIIVILVGGYLYIFKQQKI